MDTHPLDGGLALECFGQGEWRGKTSPHYGNMIGPFGGFIAAAFLKSVIDDKRRTGHPVALTVNFCGSIADGDFIITSKLQRGGKYTQHWSLELSQEAGVRATATLVFGARAEVFEHQVAKMPKAPAALKLVAMPKNALLKWVDAYELRFVEGAPDFTGKAFDHLRSAKTVFYVRDDPPRPLDYLSLAALSDCFFLRNLHIRGTFPPMGTVSLTTYFHATPEELNRQGNAPLLAVGDCKRLNGQFNDQQIELWATDGTLLASGVQVTWYKQ